MSAMRNTNDLVQDLNLSYRVLLNMTIIVRVKLPQLICIYDNLEYASITDGREYFLVDDLNCMYIYIYIYIYIVINRLFHWITTPSVWLDTREASSRISYPKTIVIPNVTEGTLYLHILQIRYRLLECSNHEKIFIIMDFRIIVFIFIVIFHNVSADMFSGLLPVFVELGNLHGT